MTRRLPKWAKKYRRASFRGVPFLVKAHEHQTGRRGVTHEYAGRDKPYTEDTGRQAGRFTLDAYVVGDNYFQQRDALIGACEKEGPGELVHPYLGSQEVVCLGLTVIESSDDGREAKLSLTFVEAGEPAFPAGRLSGAFALAAKASALADSSGGAFGSAFSVLGAPQFVVNSALDMVGKVADFLEGNSSGVGGLAGGLTDFAYAVRNLKADAADLIARPGALAARLTAAIGLLGSLTGDKKAKQAAFRRQATFGDDLPVPLRTTTNREREYQNHRALVEHVKVVSIANAATATSEVATLTPEEDTGEIVSLEDARALRTDLVQEIDELLGEVTNDGLFQALSDLKADLIKHVPSKEVELPRLRTLVPPMTVPSLVLVYDLYGDLRREADLLTRNNIAHPGFLLGGKRLEVIGG